MTAATKKMETIAPAVDRDKLMIEAFRADPDYADLYLKTALEEGLPRRRKKRGWRVKVFTVRYLKRGTRRLRR